MNFPILYELYRKVPSPLKVLDELLYTEPVIEQCSSFEMKSLLVTYSFVAGIFFDERANKKFRIIWFAYNIGSSLVTCICGIFYLMNLNVYNMRVVILAAVQILMVLMKNVCLLGVYRSYDEIKRTVEFFLSDQNNWKAEIPSNIADHCIEVRDYGYELLNVEILHEETNEGRIEMKKCVIMLVLIYLSCHIFGALFFDPANKIRTLVRSCSSIPHFFKYFVIWCPFETKWFKQIMSMFQDFLLIPELYFFGFSVTWTFLTVIEIHNKFVTLREKLRISSKNTFKQIEVADYLLEKTITLRNKALRLRDTRQLEIEKTQIIVTFYEDFLPYVKRYQELKRFQLSCRFLNAFFSLCYVSIYPCMCVFGFLILEALSNDDVVLDVDFFVKISPFFFGGVIWYICCVMGNIFSKQNDLFVEEVYSIPWYFFTSNQCKIMPTFLAIVQKPIYLKVLNWFSLTKETFPGFLNSVYSFMQFMRTFHKAKFRNG